MTAWLDPRGGQGSWEPTRPHGNSLTDLLVAFIACLLGLTLLAGLVLVGRAAMCDLHAGDATPISYCQETPR